MARELSKLVNKDELPQLLENLLMGLTDVEVGSTSGTCVVLNGLIKLRGELFLEHDVIITYPWNFHEFSFLKLLLKNCEVKLMNVCKISFSTKPIYTVVDTHT